MEFLLECVGIPPTEDCAHLVHLVREHGEPVPWRGPGGEHLRLPLADGLELRADREEGSEHWTILPYYREQARLRVAVQSVRKLEDSPFDALLTGWAAPTTREADDAWLPPGAYQLAAWLTDARRLPRNLLPGRVLAVSIAGFALDVTFVGPNQEAPDESVYSLPRGASLAPLGGPEEPGGCMEVSARVKSLRHTENPHTSRRVMVLEVDAPERPLHLFVSPWQLEVDGLPLPRPGWRIEGSFLFLGRIAGGLPGPSRRARRHFG